MWCIVSSSTWSSAASRTSRPRISGPRSRSKGAPASSRHQPPQLRLRVRPPAQVVLDQVEPARLRRRDALHRLAVHLREGGAQRLVARHDAVQRAHQRRRGPARPAGAGACGCGTCCPGPPAAPGTRAAAARTRAARGPPGPRARSAEAPRAPRVSSSRAKSASTGRANSSPSATSTPSTCRTREITCTASSEWPPSSKKWSWRPTRSTPSTSAQISASACSVSPAGAS